jgi:hypothetical protein
VKTDKPELPLEQAVEGRRAQKLPLLGHPELTLRDEANVMTRAGYKLDRAQFRGVTAQRMEQLATSG